MHTVVQALWLSRVLRCLDVPSVVVVEVSVVVCGASIVEVGVSVVDVGVSVVVVGVSVVGSGVSVVGSGLLIELLPVNYFVSSRIDRVSFTKPSGSVVGNVRVEWCRKKKAQELRDLYIDQVDENKEQPMCIVSFVFQLTISLYRFVSLH